MKTLDAAGITHLWGRIKALVEPLATKTALQEVKNSIDNPVALTTAEIDAAIESGE